MLIPPAGVVETRFLPAIEHVGFEGIVHGGAIATVLDEAMVWAASWHGKRFCVCGEMSVRFRQSAGPPSDSGLAVLAWNPAGRG